MASVAPVDASSAETIALFDAAALETPESIVFDRNSPSTSDPDGTVETLLDADDLLDGPTSCGFGRRGQNRKNLYITSAAFPQFTTTFRPSVLRLRLDVPGVPSSGPSSSHV